MVIKKLFRIKIDNSEHLVTVKRKDKTILEVTLDGKLYNVSVEQQEENSTSFSPTKPIELNPLISSPELSSKLEMGEKQLEKETLTEYPKISNLKSAIITKLVSAPIPGKIINVFVNVGDFVRSGQVLLQLEAMKMSNDVISPCNGKIVKIVSLGVNVAYKDELVSIETGFENDGSNE